jgi:phosphinothricin acetyltransferase
MLIRSAALDDVAAMQAIYAPYVDETPISFEEAAPSVDEMAARWREVTERYPWVVAEVEGRVVGYAYATEHRSRPAYRWSVDVAVYVARETVRRGVGTRLYEVLLPRVAALGYANAFAGITLPNAASVALHERMGFTPIAVYAKVGFKRGRWHDTGWWQKGFAHPAQPTEPRREGDATRIQRPDSLP